MKIAELREFGCSMGREKIAKRVLEIAKEIIEDGSYKRAIEGAGQLSVLARMCTFDSYWGEKKQIGESREYHIQDWNHIKSKKVKEV